jgi:hypothetical protein
MLVRPAFYGFTRPALPSPDENPPNGTGWTHEIKHDGYRLMARRDLWRCDSRSPPEVIARRESSYTGLLVRHGHKQGASANIAGLHRSYDGDIEVIIHTAPASLAAPLPTRVVLQNRQI